MPRPRDLRLVAGAVGLSALGDWLALVPLALHVEETTGSGPALAALFIALWGPSAVLAGPVGLLVDRASPARVLVAVSLAQAAVAVALAFTTGLAPLLALVTLLGCGFAVAQAAEFALVGAVVGTADVRRANGWVETARYAGFTAGPLLGGLLAAGGGAQVALLVNAATFLAVAAGIVTIRARPARARAGAHERARDGVVALAQDRVLALVIGVVALSLLVMTATATAEVFFARDVLGVGEAGYGALAAAWTVGMAGGALALARAIPAPAVAAAALAAIVAQGAGIALPAVWPVFGLALAFFAVGGMAHGAKNVLLRTLIHQRVPEHVRGRAFAAYNGLRNAAELVALAGGGLLLMVAGPRLTLLIAGTVPALVAVAGLAAHRRLAHALPLPA